MTPQIPYWFYVAVMVMGASTTALTVMALFIFLCGKAYRWLTFETSFWPYRWEAIQKYARDQRRKETAQSEVRE